MEEKVKISVLLEIYGNILTQKQRDFMEYYYNEDLSLSEIADNNNITRQAVRTILVKSKNKLEEYEKQLKFMKKEKNIKNDLEKLKKSNVDKDIIANIEKQLDF